MKKLLAALFTAVFAIGLSVPVFAQEGSTKEEGKETPAPEKTEKVVSGRWEGIVLGSDKNRSTLTVRRRDGFARVIHYDNSTQWTSQEHHSTKINSIDASDVKSDDRVICVGFYDAKGGIPRRHDFETTLKMSSTPNRIGETCSLRLISVIADGGRICRYLDISAETWRRTVCVSPIAHRYNASASHRTL